MNFSLQRFLGDQVLLFNHPSFIKDDPVSIPHLFSKKQDIEIAGLFAAVFAWGKRTTIINKSKELMQLMHMAPYEFVLHHQDDDLKKLLHFKHRTFNTTDLLYFIAFLQHHYKHYDSLENAFLMNDPADMTASLNNFHHYFFSLENFPHRTKKHIAAPEKKATCKRLNMYLRWMVRNDDKGVDFGLWKKIKPSQLICPIDVHVLRVAKHFGLLNTKHVDWQAALDLTERLRSFDPNDPVKYDFALFGLGVTGKY